MLLLVINILLAVISAVFAVVALFGETISNHRLTRLGWGLVSTGVIIVVLGAGKELVAKSSEDEAQRQNDKRVKESQDRESNLQDLLEKVQTTNVAREAKLQDALDHLRGQQVTLMDQVTDVQHQLMERTVQRDRLTEALQRPGALPAGLVQGTVFDRAGDPIHDVRVEAFADEVSLAEVSTGADGTYRLQFPPPKEPMTIRVRFLAAGREAYTTEPLYAGVGHEVNIVLPGGRL
jgi:carboxypeptidase family protein